MRSIFCFINIFILQNLGILPLVLADSLGIYGNVLDPLKLKIHQKTDFVSTLSQVEFPVIKANVGQKDHTPVLCEVRNSLPNIKLTSILHLSTQDKISHLIVFEEYLYLIYANLSINVAQNIWSQSKNLFDFQIISTSPSLLDSSKTYENVHVIVSKQSKIFQLWTSDTLFLFSWEPNSGKLLFTNSHFLKNPNIDLWLKYQLREENAFFLDKNKTDRIQIVYPASDGSNQLSYGLVLPNLLNDITDFFVTYNYLYIVESRRGVHVYTKNYNTSEWIYLTFLEESRAKKVTGADNICIIISEDPKDNSFQVIEYVKKSNVFREIARRNFNGKFSGSIDVEKTKIFMLNENVMFAWYHSIPESVQSDKEKIMTSFVFYGEEKITEIDQNPSSHFIYTRLRNQIKSYQVFDKDAEIFCSLNALTSTEETQLNYNLELIGMTCPLKEIYQNFSSDSICLYRQTVEIIISSEFNEKTDWGWASLIGFGFSIIILGLIMLIYYLIKFKKNSQYLKDTLDIIRNKMINENIGFKSSKKLLRDVAYITGDLNLLHEEEEISRPKENTENFPRILPTQIDETLKSDFPFKQGKLELEEGLSDVKEDKTGLTPTALQKSREDYFKKDIKSGSSNFDA